MIFSQEEFNSRIAKVKQSMNKRGVDILLTTDPSNMNYLTGYDGWSFYVPQGVIISIDEDQPFWFGRKQDSNGARITTFLNEENIGKTKGTKNSLGDIGLQTLSNNVRNLGIIQERQSLSKALRPKTDN